MSGIAGVGEVGRKSDHWSSRFTFVMAAVGSSVGLGNFWRFPYTAGENGGGAFILIYLVCVAFVAFPILVAEYALGRSCGKSSMEGVADLAAQSSANRNWAITAWIGAAAAFFILTFYMVISGWILAYIPIAFSGAFAGLDADGSGALFGETISNTPLMLTCLAVFIAACAITVGRGLRGGLERAAALLMPTFFIVLAMLVVYAMSVGDVGQTLAFIFVPDFSKVTFVTFLEALGQAFFSVGVGCGLMITYGAYLDRETDIPRSSAMVAGADTFVALIAGLALFPIVFAFGADPAGGPGLFFVSLPIALGQMPLGAIFGGAFFTLALFAAFTSAISLMEVSVSWLEERHGVTRPGAAAGVGGFLFMIGAGYIYSTDYIDFADFITGNLLLPLGGLLMALFAGWAVDRKLVESELGDSRFFQQWRFLIRWFVPGFVGAILVFGALDKAQNNCWLALPGVLELLLGESPSSC